MVTYVYPEELRTSGANAPQSGIYNYGQYITISIYEPTATEINEDLLVASLEGAAPFLAAYAAGKISNDTLAKFISGAGVSELVAGVISFGNLPADIKDILNNGLGGNLSGLEQGDIDKLSGIDGFKSIAGALKTAKNSRIPDSRSRLGLGILFQEAKTSIALPMPKQIKTNYGFEYSEEDFTAVNLLNSIKNVGIDIASIMSGGAINLDAAAAALESSAASPSAKAGLASFLKTIPSGYVDKSFDLIGLNPNLTSFMQASSNRAKVPYLEKVFKNVKRRSFELDYTFIPKSPDEVELIYNIVKELKKHAHPRKTNNDYYYITPSEFVVKFEFMGEENEFLPKYGRLAIDSINVDYGSSDGFSAFRPIRPTTTGDKKFMVSPSEIKMSISFTELELLTQGRIEEGY